MYQRARNLLRAVLAVAIGLPLLSSCYSYPDSEELEQEIISQKVASYINLTVAVSRGTGNVTRAGELPTTGENGDGREAGFERENAVSGITLILFQDATEKGINGAANLPFSFIEYYPVSRCEDPARVTEGTSYGKEKKDEAFYTTGNQRIEKNALNFSESYYAIVIANADLRGMVSNLGQIRDYIFRYLYDGNEQSQAKDCRNFIMSSEFNHKITFPAQPTALEGNNVLYDLSDNPIRIERLAARIDFSSANSNGYKTSVDNAAYTTPGYEYSVTGTSDKFVVTGITPFNLNGGDATHGGEWLIKRLAKAVTETPEVSYLIDEDDSQYKYVLDPGTQYKTSGELTYFKNRLASLPATGETLADVTTLSANAYYRSVENMHTAVTAPNTVSGFVNNTEEIAIITYPMENTLWESSRLFTCATGIAIEGDYYFNGTGTPLHRIFYGYLRHQGTASSYSATLGANMSSTETTTATNCMEFGIVRNNIYRVYISKINSIQNMTINIKVKKWDRFEHAVIYM